MTDKKFTKILIESIANAKELMDWGIAGGHTTVEDLQLTPQARVKRAKELSDAGMGIRSIAAALDTSKSQIARDLSRNGTESVPNGDTDGSTSTELGQSKKREESLREQLKVAQTPVVLPSRRYGTIVIDPPWPMKKIEREVRPNQVEFDYPTMNYEQLRSWRPHFKDMTDDDCHVFMWTTHKFLPMALTLFEDYGVKYVLTMVWHKPGGFQPVGLPQYNCEFVVYGRVGTPKFTDTKAFNCCFEAKRTEHSRKPDEFYDLVRRVTPDGRIDVFSRESRSGFDQFGNQLDKFSEAS